MFGRGRKKTRTRIEPRLNSRGGRAVGGDLRADPADRPPTSSRKKKNGPSRSGSGAKRGRPRRSVVGHLVYWGVVLSVWGAIFLAGLFVYYASQLPPIDQLAVPKRPPNIAILSDDGSLIANRGDTGGPAVRLIDLPPYLPKAFVAIEDRRFYDHHGVDPIGMSRALLRDVVGGGGIEGGSTLTQQLAKNLFLTQERTAAAQDPGGDPGVLARAPLLEGPNPRTLSEPGLFRLGRVWGRSGGAEILRQERAVRDAVGSRGARRAHEVADETCAQPQPPRGPTSGPRKSSRRWPNKAISPRRWRKASLANPAQVKRDKSAGSINYAADYVMDALNDTVGAIDEDIVVTTTIDLKMQAEAEHALTDELNAKGAKFGVEQGALVALDPNGAVKAMIGGRNYADSQFNRAVAAKRQPGSSFKPFVYLAALEKGLTPDTVRDDAPISIKG